MESQYDTKAWAAETTTGRHIFNYNYRMTGEELKGWELVSSTVMQNEAGVSEKIYMWQKKGSEGHQLIRIGIAELHDWQHAQNQLHNQLLHSMRPEVPRGTGKLSDTGDVNFVGKDAQSKTVSHMLFTRGNLAVSVSSAGDKAVDVSKFAKQLDGLFSEPPSKTDMERGAVEELSPKSLMVKQKRRTTIMEDIPKQIAPNGWLKVIAPDGEIVREENALLYKPTKVGRNRIGKYIVNQ